MVQQVKAEIQDFLRINDNGEVNPNILWDTLKAVVRGKLISLSAAMKKAKENRLNQLEKKLGELEKRHSENQSEQIMCEIKEIRNHISNCYKDELDKKYKYLKQSYYEVVPRATKLLAKRIRKKQISQSVYKILDTGTGQTYNNLDEIDAAFQTYYRKLYSQTKQDCK